MPRETSCNSTDDAFIVIRLTSHFLEFVAPKLESFKEEHQGAFEGREGGEGAGEDYDLEMTALYTTFCEIFEAGMEDYLESDAGIPKTHLRRILKKGVDASKQGEDTMATILVDLLDAVGSFEGFVNFMVDGEDQGGGLEDDAGLTNEDEKQADWGEESKMHK
ncbi:hypothetical protein TrRE_jg3253 [Triparma retinervis]|uniref:BART domain-containing protein n=1 Tax=Triparma retinervis TaxID=2557542 RepID=A0A9W7DK10_9STRA|nr:hypothetical protein TrRE_jg3253 [Triparma retinervis]